VRRPHHCWLRRARPPAGVARVLFQGQGALCTCRRWAGVTPGAVRLGCAISIDADAVAVRHFGDGDAALHRRIEK
jgi:hypothetical protein